MDCPACTKSELHPTQLDDGLVAVSCSSCDGVLLSLLVYRGWLETHGGAPTSVEPDATLQEDGEGARLCPKCNRFMTKFAIHASTGNRLDLCQHCDEVWLDDGEWPLLQHLRLLPELPKVFTDAWQFQIRRQQRDRTRKDRLRSQLGEEDYSRVHDFSDWLHDHPLRHRIRAWLNDTGVD